MAGRGPAPKQQHQRDRDTARRIDDKAIRVPDTPFPNPPKLPPGDWSSASERWWDGWASSPQAHTFSQTDWIELETTLHLVEAFFDGDHSKASEIRLRVAKWGATPEDRARLRLQFVPPDEQERPKLAAVRSLDERRKKSLED